MRQMECPRLDKMMKNLILLPVLVLAACGPISVEEAERQCFERARLAQQPRGEIAVGMNSDGKAGGAFEVEISGDYLAGRDPAAVYETCVTAKSGEPPSRPLYARPDWKD
jgi:hypothetical protein